VLVGVTHVRGLSSVLHPVLHTSNASSIVCSHETSNQPKVEVLQMRIQDQHVLV
jgi:hypothetical protein